MRRKLIVSLIPTTGNPQAVLLSASLFGRSACALHKSRPGARKKYKEAREVCRAGAAAKYLPLLASDHP
ncbi:hypothetical protein OE88DRAFT_1653486 [Heliocybe sulcata]|uniref:Uncharacterized protein n=1 Tax=Heliocybe sulcata TaxID=5364 RepID=A0A5C3NMQ8_9AGAM|nr:hypothetical protein OE88DRAFT_1653486 [Heliocybe sulcata]